MGVAMSSWTLFLLNTSISGYFWKLFHSSRYTNATATSQIQFFKRENIFDLNRLFLSLIIIDFFTDKSAKSFYQFHQKKINVWLIVFSKAIMNDCIVYFIWLDGIIFSKKYLTKYFDFPIKRKDNFSLNYLLWNELFTSSLRHIVPHQRIFQKWYFYYRHTNLKEMKIFIFFFVFEVLMVGMSDKVLFVTFRSLLIWSHVAYLKISYTLWSSKSCCHKV